MRHLCGQSVVCAGGPTSAASIQPCAGVDSVGGVLASGLGLTQSRYQFEIDYAQRQREQIRSRIIARRQRDLLVLEERRRRGAAAGGAPADSRSVEKAVSDRIELERTARARERAERGEEEEEEGDADKTFFEAAAEAEARAERETAAAVAPSASGPAPKGAASAV